VRPKKKAAAVTPNRKHLPVVRQVIDLPEAQKAGLICIREEITKQLEYKASQLYMLHLVRPVYASPTRAHAPIVAALPPQVIPQAGVGPGFVTHVVVAKYVDHIPLYRREGIDARAGVWVPRQARCRYLDSAAHLLITIREQLKQKVLASGYVQVDETFTKLIDPERRGRSHDAYLWGLSGPARESARHRVFASRSGTILHDFFPKKWVGQVQTDGAKMYPSVFKHRPNIIRFECIAHLRRYVLAAIKANELEALPLLRDITTLYRIERQATRLGLSHTQRGYWRHSKAKPVLKRLHQKFRVLAANPTVVGNLREAVTYATNRWPFLARYAKVGFGHIKIDQNSIEGCFRPSKVGLRNYLFVGRPAAGWRSAVIYSVVGTCRILGVNPEAYLRWVLPQLAAGTNHSTASGLLPHDFARLHPSEAVVVPHGQSPSS
jgi:transposase